jgi:tRNA pseudouridine65 synthase
LLPVLYQDDHLVAVNKPAGLLTHRSDIDKHETLNAMRLLRDQLQRRVYVLHRLDKPTSGVLLFALDTDTARRMGQLIEEDRVQKTYLAVVRGYAAEAGTIDHPLEKIWDKTTDRLADRTVPPQPAVTDYQRLATVELPFAVTDRHPTVRYSLLQVTPRTGRNRQIRRHMKHIFHHVVGDTTHGDGKHNAFFREHFGCHRLLLHAVRLAFPHPVTGRTLVIDAPLDEAFGRVLRELGWEGVACIL